MVNIPLDTALLNQHLFLITTIPQPKKHVKGIVQRKLRWVESGVNLWIMLQYWGAGHYFLILKRHHLVFRIKRFAAT